MTYLDTYFTTKKIYKKFLIIVVMEKPPSPLKGEGVFQN